MFINIDGNVCHRLLRLIAQKLTSVASHKMTNTNVHHAMVWANYFAASTASFSVIPCMFTYCSEFVFLQIWRHNYDIDCSEYLVFTLSVSTVNCLRLLQFCVNLCIILKDIDCVQEKTPTHIFFHISMNYTWI